MKNNPYEKETKSERIERYKRWIKETTSLKERAEKELKKTSSKREQKELKEIIKGYQVDLKELNKEIQNKNTVKAKKTRKNDEDIYYSINFRYINPYIESRSTKKAGKQYENLTLKEASEKMLDIYNRIFDEKYAYNWGMAVIQSRGKCDGASGSGDRKRVSYDSRVYEIVPEY